MTIAEVANLEVDIHFVLMHIILGGSTPFEIDAALLFAGRFKVIGGIILFSGRSHGQVAIF